jgi:cell division protein FtsI (penicillin-binding protein 3)
MAKPAARVGFIQFCLMLGTLAVLAKAAKLQLVEGDQWAAKARSQRTVHEEIPAWRGTIHDRSGMTLVGSQLHYRVNIAPDQVRDTAAFVRAVARALDVPAAELRRRIGSGRRSVYYGGPFDAVTVLPVRSLPGMHLMPVYPRVGRTDLARTTVGLFDIETSAGVSGIERMLDSVLAGIPGETVWLTDVSRRARYASPSRLGREPVRGNDVWLTIDARLQEIAESALDRAIEAMRAKGGNAIFLDPATGELLAVASRVEGERSAASAFTAPFEPGSTAKLFTAAALLEHGLVDSTDRVDGENGVWVLETPGRDHRITDVHVAKEPMTLEMAVALSSNIGLAKFSQRLEPGQLYDMLRRFGFGSSTGLGFPAEASGGVPPLIDWKPGYTRESLSRGYNFNVTAIQLAAAYGAIANGGILFAPSLVREIRSPEGDLLYRHRPEPVRRVISESTAASLRRFMRKAVSAGGQADRAIIEELELAGKTGTARKVVNGHYVSRYFSSFAAIWPSERPELVAIVTIDEPEGVYYGSQTAAPLTKDILEQALASRNQAFDYQRLAARDSLRVPERPRAAAQERPGEAAVVAVDWPAKPNGAVNAIRPVPDVAGRPAREAIALLHAEGFRVAVDGLGAVSATEPRAGTPVRTGATITIQADAPLPH